MIAAIDLRFINRFVHGVGAERREAREEERSLVVAEIALRKAAAKDASVCADCFRRLAPNQPSTMTTRNVGTERAAADPAPAVVAACRRRRRRSRESVSRGRSSVTAVHSVSEVSHPLRTERPRGRSRRSPPSLSSSPTMKRRCAAPAACWGSVAPRTSEGDRETLRFTSVGAVPVLAAGVNRHHHPARFSELLGNLPAPARSCRAGQRRL
jgi:hypothetical protein